MSSDPARSLYRDGAAVGTFGKRYGAKAPEVIALAERFSGATESWADMLRDCRRRNRGPPGIPESKVLGSHIPQRHQLPAEVRSAWGDEGDAGDLQG